MAVHAELYIKRDEGEEVICNMDGRKLLSFVEDPFENHYGIKVNEEIFIGSDQQNVVQFIIEVRDYMVDLDDSFVDKMQMYLDSFALGHLEIKEYEQVYIYIDI